MSSREPRPGALVGPYRLESLLGRGAGGVVFRARHVQTGAIVAIKLLTLASQTAQERFEREVETFAKLRHPNVVAIHAAGKHEGGRWYAMDLVEGPTLDQILASRSLPLKERVRLLLQVARGMEHAHGRGVIHRDLKPQNVLVGQDRIARVTDFGIARDLDRQTRLTQDASFLGTPHYMSPEQASGGAALADERTDIWSLGVMLYEAVTGALPFVSETQVGLVVQICSVEPLAPRTRVVGLPADLEAIILHALEKDPGRRYETTGELASDLESWLKDERVSVSRSGWSRFRATLGRKTTSSWTLAGACLAVALTALVVGVLSLRGTHARQDDPATTRTSEAEREALASLSRLRAPALSPGERRALAAGALARLDLESPAATCSPARAGLVLEVAQGLLRDGDPGAARALLETAPAEKDVDLTLALADARAATDPGAALALYERAARLAPERWEPILRRAEVRPAADPEPELARARERKAPAAQLDTTRAVILRAKGRHEEALATVERAIKADPELARARFLRAQLLVESGADNAAIAELRSVSPRDATAAARIEAKLLLELGASADAARALERGADLAPENATLAVELAEMRAALGDLDQAAAGLVRSIGLARGAVDRPARVPVLLEALIPIEAARERDVAPIVLELSALAPDDARCVLARALAEKDSKARGPALAAGILREKDGRARARLLTELARIERQRGDDASARRHLDEALVLSPRCARAHGLLAALDALEGKLGPASAHHEAATHGRSQAALRAFAEGQADVLAIQEGLGSATLERMAEDQDRGAPSPDFAASGGPTPELEARAKRSLAYAAALEPNYAAPRVLIARLAAAKDPGGARALAALALDADPLDPEAARVTAELEPLNEAPRVIARTFPAVTAAPASSSYGLRRAVVPHLLALGRFADAGAAAVRLARERPADRRSLVLARDVLAKAGDVTSAQWVGETLEKLDATNDLARERARKADVLMRSNKGNSPVSIATARAAFELAPGDAEAMASWATALRYDGTGTAKRVAPPGEVFVVFASASRTDGRDAALKLRMASRLTISCAPDSLPAWRARAADETAPHEERLVLDGAIALYEAGNFLCGPRDRYVPGASNFMSGAAAAEPPRPSLARLERCLAAFPENQLFLDLRALHLARLGLRDSVRRDLKRMLECRPPGVHELWCATAISVTARDVDGAVGHAGRAREITDDLAFGAFLEEYPMTLVADDPLWASVRARARRR